MMRTHLYWGQSQEAVIDTLEDLEQLLEQLTNEAVRVGMPIGIHAQVNPETMLGLSIGRRESHDGR